MGTIYRNGIVNIAATGFSDGRNGLFSQRDPDILTPIRVIRRKESSQTNCFLLDLHTWKDGVREAPLYKRGWVLQERILSVRTLHFGRQQLFWECQCEVGNEVFPRGFVKGTFVMNPKWIKTEGWTRTKEED